ncbi:MAG: FKBP-type peptidyl-prolyl cis-trans isomerase [Pseudomonadales bacterium]|nr:FKBP-type peptidyl-prolyl cis-trans isomerase [Pseudomonadales bacterium]
MSKIQEGSKIQLFFQLSFDDGTVVDSNRDNGPAECEIGKGILLPSIEEALIGMLENEKKKLVLKPEEAYGPADPNAYMLVPLEQLPKEAREIGKTLNAEDESGEQRTAIVVEINEKTIKLDMNHPYAGRTLIFDLEVVSVSN